MFSILAQAPDRWDYFMPQVQWDSSIRLSGTDCGDYCHKKEMSTTRTSTATRLTLPEHRSAVQLFQMQIPNSQGWVPAPCEAPVSFWGERWVCHILTSSCVSQLSLEMWDCGQEENSSVFH